MSTVKLKFLGGPKDGGCQQIPSGDLRIGFRILYPADSGSGCYVSEGPYEGLETEIAMEYFTRLEIRLALSQKIK